MSYPKPKSRTPPQEWYYRLTWWTRCHRERWRRRVESIKPQLTCQECRGGGGEIEVIDPYIGGPFMECGYCEGTGLVDPHRRSLWLRHQRELKRERLKVPPAHAYPPL